MVCETLLPAGCVVRTVNLCKTPNHIPLDEPRLCPELLTAYRDQNQEHEVNSLYKYSFLLLLLFQSPEFVVIFGDRNMQLFFAFKLVLCHHVLICWLAAAGSRVIQLHNKSHLPTCATPWITELQPPKWAENKVNSFPYKSQGFPDA